MTGEITLPEGQEMVMPGDDTQMTVQLIQPIAMDEDSGSPFARAARSGRRRHEDDEVEGTRNRRHQKIRIRLKGL